MKCFPILQFVLLDFKRVHPLCTLDNLDISTWTQFVEWKVVEYRRHTNNSPQSPQSPHSTALLAEQTHVTLHT